jgi:putative membrane protein
MKLKTTLFSLYLLIWIGLAYDPSYRDDWLLENILVFAALPIVLWAERRFEFSKTSVWMLFIFFVLHALGAHYTYSEMPWFSPVTEFFGFERNHYDRLIHFLFGFLLFLPFYELFSSFKKFKQNALLFTFVFLIAASGTYEVVEWIATEATHAELGTAFLGMQGDPWDSQKDMAISYLGSLLSFLLWSRITAKSL